MKEKMKPACPSCERGELHSTKPKKFVEFGVSMRLEETQVFECSQCLREFKEEVKGKFILLPPLQDKEIPHCFHCGKTLAPPKTKKIMGIDILEYYCKHCDIQLSEEEVLQ